MFQLLLKSNKFFLNSLPALWSFLNALESRVSNSEKIVVLLLSVMFTAAFCDFQLVTAWLHHLDAAFLMETLDKIKETGIPTTYLGPSFIDAYPTFTLTSEKICSAELIPSGRGLSVFDSHAYYILYPLSLFTWVFPPHVVLAVANGICFSSVIFIVYWLLRKQGTSIIGAVAFCFLVMAHPAWSHASLGDFYVDRFFIPLGLLYISLLYNAFLSNDKLTIKLWALIVIVGLLAASTTERAAIMVALYTIAFVVLYYKEILGWKPKIILLVFSLVLFAHVFLYVKFLYYHHPGTGNLMSLIKGSLQFFEMLKSSVYAAKVTEFLVINILMFGVFALFSWRLAIIAFATLLPNLLTTIGGAEKTGWATHYHSMYFPFLTFAAAIGYSKLLFVLKHGKYRFIATASLFILIPILLGYSKDYGQQNGAVKRLYKFYLNGDQAYEKSIANQLNQVTEAIPLGSKVTTPEGFVPTLYQDRTIYYYPIGIDSADYAVLTRLSQPDGSFYYAGAISYLGEGTKLDICLTDRLEKVGYNIDEPFLLVGNIAVLKRSKE